MNTNAAATQQDEFGEVPDDQFGAVAETNSDDQFGAVPDVPTPAQQPAPTEEPAPAIFKSNSAAIQNFVKQNLDSHFASLKEKGDGPPAAEAHSFLDALEAGLQTSSSGLAIRGKMPDVVLPEHADRALRIASQIGQLTGDLPEMVVGGFGGAITGAVAGGLAGGAIANIPGALIGAGLGAAGGFSAGAFAAPAAMRKILMDHYEKGDIKDAGEFVDRLMSTSWETIKAGTTGLATSMTGGIVKPVAGAVVGLGAELAAMTTTAAALEGHLPTFDEFVDGAIVLGGLHGVMHVAPKLRAIYAQTGERPSEIIERAQTDVELKQSLLTVDPSADGKIDVNLSGQEKIPVGSFNPETGEIYKNGKAPTVEELKTEFHTKLSEMTGDRWSRNSDGTLTIQLSYPDAVGDSWKTHDKAVEIEKEIRAMGGRMIDSPHQPGDAQSGTLLLKIKEPNFEKRAEKLSGVSPSEPPTITEPPIEPPGEEPPSGGGEEPPEPPDRSAETEILSKMGESEKPTKKTFKERFREWYAHSIDFLDPLSTIEKAAKDEMGVETAPEDSAYVKGRLFAAHMDKIRGFFEFGTRDATTNEINGEGLNVIFKEASAVKPTATTGGGLDGYRAYGLAKRALELDERGIEPYKDFDREKAQKVVDDNAEHYEELNQRRIDFENRVLDYAGAKGLFSEKQLERMKEANKAHFPFNRVQEADVFTGNVKGGTAVKRIFGSDKDILDPILQTYKNTEAIIRKAEINDVRLTTLKILREGGMLEEGDHPNPNATLKKVQPKMIPIEIEAQEISRALSKQGINLSADDVTIFRPDKSFLKDNQVIVFDDGHKVVYEGSPLVIETLKRLDGDKTAMHLTTRIAAGFSKATRLGVVLNPAFGFRHFFRSQIMSGIYSETGMIPFYHAALGLKDFFSAEKSQAYQDWMYHGGPSASWFKVDDTYFANNVLSPEVEAKAPFWGRAWNVVKHAKDISETFIKVTDNAARFAEYKRSVDMGVSKTEAAFRSREVVPDYQKIGMQRSALRMSIAFVGAHINSTDRMIQEWKTDPVGASLKASALTAMSTLLWVTNNWGYNDKGDYVYKPDEAIDQLPDWQKMTYWNFNITRMFGGTDAPKDSMILRLPKPWAPGIIFGSGVEVALDSFFKDKPNEFEHFVHSVRSSIFPEAFPNIAQPILDQYANRNAFTGRPLVSQDKEKLLPELQYEPYTSETAKQVAKLIGYTPLGEVGPHEDRLASGAVVDHYIRAWTGPVGQWAVKLIDVGLRKSGISPQKNPPASGLENTPFFMEFVSRFPNAKAQSIEDFYDTKNEVDTIVNSIKYEGKKGHYQNALTLMEKYPEMEQNLNDIAGGIAEARKAMHGIQDDPKMPPVEKRQLIDTILFQMMSMAKIGNQRMSDFKKSVKASDATKKEN